MGKGDKKSRKGKITRGSYGKTRPQKPTKATASKPDTKPATE
ncbi:MULTISPECIES: 30S ribosomal protein THX [Spirosoma]|uniref:30S ribosomal protein THX n=1 Tax=Spirosoma liriopis TaxID=2937440 RepID=A0ABT0HPP5_9BACT|nr:MULTISPECIES: 30S ribosomal protein THX [Spirosoma]MCK8494141.1 30S ribosomal protein THX [Spirosoma liriopis]UHG93683.1 30S ribosomal protein THX [Spirosoma oryzicola]